jgi:hypothetical protein
MLTPGESLDTASPDLSVLQSRLAAAVSDIAKLAGAIGALAHGRDTEAAGSNGTREHHRTDGFAAFPPEIGETTPALSDPPVTNRWAAS